MKKHLFNALESANAELSKKDQVKINSDLMEHIAGGASSGLLCTVSGECNSDGLSCNPLTMITQIIDRAADEIRNHPRP